MKLAYFIKEDEKLSFSLLNIVRNHICYDINELFNTDVKTNIKSESNDILMMSFMAKDRYTVYMIEVDSHNNIWNIMFYKTLDVYTNPRNMLSSGGKDMNVGLVMAGVFNCIDVLIKKKKVDGIVFVTDDDGLKKFYIKLIPYIEREFKDFKFKTKQIEGSKLSFMFTRKTS